MMPDPGAIGSFEWGEIGTLLRYLWYYVAAVVVFGALALTSLAFIPSLVSTGHIPENAKLLRFSITVTALGTLVLALAIMLYIVNVAHVLEVIYDRFWM